MGASRQQRFDPAGAGAVLLGAAGACIGLGALVGYASGSTGIGVGAGAACGVPAGIAAVYYRYRGSI